MFIKEGKVVIIAYTTKRVDDEYYYYRIMPDRSLRVWQEVILTKICHKALKKLYAVDIMLRDDNSLLILNSLIEEYPTLKFYIRVFPIIDYTRIKLTKNVFIDQRRDNDSLQGYPCGYGIYLRDLYVEEHTVLPEINFTADLEAVFVMENRRYNEVIDMLLERIKRGMRPVDILCPNDFIWKFQIHHHIADTIRDGDDENRKSWNGERYVFSQYSTKFSRMRQVLSLMGRTPSDEIVEEAMMIYKGKKPYWEM